MLIVIFSTSTKRIEKVYNSQPTWSKTKTYYGWEKEKSAEREGRGVPEEAGEADRDWSLRMLGATLHDFNFHTKSNGRSIKGSKRSTLYKDFFGYGVKTRLKGGRENFATIVRTISRALPLQSSNFFKGTILPEKETVIKKLENKILVFGFNFLRFTL